MLSIQSQRYRRILEKLEDLNVNVFYPMKVVWRKQRSGPRKRVEQPLIPAYLFVACDLTQRSARSILSIDGIRSFIGVGGVPSACDDDQLNYIQQLWASGDYDETARIIEQMIVGQVVTVQQGPFKDFQATITSIKGDAIKANVALFGRTNEILFHVDMLRE